MGRPLATAISWREDRAQALNRGVTENAQARTTGSQVGGQVRAGATAGHPEAAGSDAPAEPRRAAPMAEHDARRPPAPLRGGPPAAVQAGGSGLRPGPDAAEIPRPRADRPHALPILGAGGLSQAQTPGQQ